MVPYEGYTRQRRQVMMRLGIGIVAALVVFASVFVAGFSVGSSGKTTVTPKAPPAVTEVKLTDETTYVKAQVVSVVEGEETTFKVFTTKRTMLAVADCRFGIDYKKFAPNIDPNLSTREVKVTVVEPYNLGCEPSLAKSRFIEGGGLVPATADLYNALGAKAANEIGQEAVKLGYAQQAMESARNSLELLFRKAGFEKVSVVFLKP